MNWLLDTNACIRYLNGRAPGLKRRIDATNPSDILVCSVVKAEMYFGAHRSNNPNGALDNQRRFLSRFASLIFDDLAAEVYGRIRSTLATAGTPIGPNDLLIAAIAMANSVTLVTHNTGEFGRVTGLQLEDWEP
jgi:tRNA(fMet)-specific endonuclease VapC